MAKQNDYTNFLRPVPSMESFLTYHLNGYNHRTIRSYELRLEEFVVYFCQKYNTTPSQFDVTTFTTVVSGERNYSLPMRDVVIRDYLENIPSIPLREQSQTVLRQFFNYLMLHQQIDQNPVYVERYRLKRRTPKQGLNVEQIHSLVMHVQTHLEEPYRGALMLQLASGLRIGALLHLKSKDLEQHSDRQWTLRVPPGIQKAKWGGQIPLPDITKTLKRYLEWRSADPESEYLFVDQDGNPLTPGHYNNVLKNISDEMALGRQILSHDLRRSYATFMSLYIEDPEVLSAYSFSDPVQQQPIISFVLQ